jgi:hypothetical protein
MDAYIRRIFISAADDRRDFKIVGAKRIHVGSQECGHLAHDVANLMPANLHFDRVRIEGIARLAGERCDGRDQITVFPGR